MLDKKLYDKIERLEEFEDKCSVKFENISIQYNPDYLESMKIYYELFSTVGNDLNHQYVKPHCVIYSSNGEIMGMDTEIHSKESFWGLEIGKFEFNFSKGCNIKDIGKIRIYPICSD
jgi:hypothetical protein